MQFYDSTKATNAICQEIDRLCDSDDTSYPRLDKTARVNTAYETVVSWILNADGNWQWDDDNYTTNPIGVGTLTSGQISYSFSDKFLDILEVDILDTNGIYRRLTPFDPSETGMSFEEYTATISGTTPNGLPRQYDKVGNTIKLDRTPTSANVTLAAGLKVRFKRTANLFPAVSTTVADTTVPGFASPYHAVLAYMASIPFCMTYKKDRVVLYQNIVGDFRVPIGFKKAILDFYGNREKDSRHRATMRGIKHR